MFVLGALLLSMLAACSGDDDDSSATSDPGPNPTSNDPGPNDTSGGPLTVQGTVRFVAADECVALETPDTSIVGEARLGLDLPDYSLNEDGDALVANDDGRVLAHDGDTIVITGRPGGDVPRDCGTAFTVESLNTVIPAG
jgi:hypothetical protein